MTYKKTSTPAERQEKRNKRIQDSGLVQRKVVGYKDDFEAIRDYAEKLYKKRGINLK